MFLPLHDQNNAKVTLVPLVSYAIIALTVLVFFYQTLLEIGTTNEDRNFVFRHGLVPAPLLTGNPNYDCEIVRTKPKDPKELRRPFAEAPDNSDPSPFSFSFPIRNSLLGLYLMPISYIFLHASWMHLIGNLWFFWIFADNVEERLGHLFFAGFYLFTGIAAGLLHVILNTSSTVPLIGASGAVSGLMGAYIILFPGNRITSYFCPVWFYIRRIDVPAWMVLGFYILFNLVAMAKADSLGLNVAFDAHIGGFIAGTLLCLPLRKQFGPSSA